MRPISKNRPAVRCVVVPAAGQSSLKKKKKAAQQRRNTVLCCVQRSGGTLAPEQAGSRRQAGRIDARRLSRAAAVPGDPTL
jgi:hypothetical protein